MPICDLLVVSGGPTDLTMAHRVGPSRSQGASWTPPQEVLTGHLASLGSAWNGG
jgi:hypothetical protein